MKEKPDTKKRLGSAGTPIQLEGKKSLGNRGDARGFVKKKPSVNLNLGKTRSKMRAAWAT